ncbi:Retrovirus-related Pol polyprotein from transposon TNT 1-94 [Senna tora]|uniref:Retrovirus-related Pol polyprotein from transposon TNT 1-94 n=1 Tax=Senna tora TaxID=362788 RepID=A0A834STD9_9FABA|nr:Retrovirus-related Pol polyprotein from transposon TNT 1-94 [Senna tora]
MTPFGFHDLVVSEICVHESDFDAMLVHKLVSQHEIKSLISNLHAQFALKDLGSLHYFLGLQVLPTEDHGLVLTQTKYIKDLLSHVGLTDAKPQKTPMVSGLKLRAGGDDPFSDVQQYRSIVGALQYTTLTRLDISYSVNTGTVSELGWIPEGSREQEHLREQHRCFRKHRE